MLHFVRGALLDIWSACGARQSRDRLRPEIGREPDATRQFGIRGRALLSRESIGHFAGYLTGEFANFLFARKRGFAKNHDPIATTVAHSSV